MKEIKTLVYFDLEATGLKSSGKPRITEISLIAVNIQDVLELNMKIMELQENKNIEGNVFQVESLLPRIVNKLTLCVFPMATIVPHVSDITGLDNYMLNGHSRFDENTGNLLNSFLAHLPSPVCLVAHNGDVYDFPLLKAEMEKAGTPLDLTILCVDSYVGIKDIHKKNGRTIQKEHDRKREVEKVKEMKIMEEELRAVSDLITAGEFETELEVNGCDELSQYINNSDLKTSRPISLQMSSSSPSQAGWERQNQEMFNSSEVEHTPTGTNKTLSRNVHPIKLKQMSWSEKFKSRKKLDFSIPSIPKSFSLINLHKHLLGFPPAKSHGAEADCLALLRTTAVLGKEWLDWVEENCYFLVDCRRMWGSN
jgi:DNA polymerase III epsilon subunit-like protein